MSQQKTLLQIRLPDGTKFKGNFPSHLKLLNVAKYIKNKARGKNLDKNTARGYLYEESRGFEFLICTIVPKTDYDVEKEERTLGELFGRGTNLVVKDKFENPQLRRGEGTIHDARFKLMDGNSFLKGDTFEKKEAYKKKKREEEALERKKDHAEKKLKLQKVLLDIEEDKLARVSKVWVKDEKEEKSSEFPSVETGPETSPKGVGENVHGF